MSIISDITDTSSGNNTQNLYQLTLYTIGKTTQANTNVNITIYGVISQDINQVNLITNKPLEQSNFTSDSKQIKPIAITLRGVLYPSDSTAFISGYNYSSLSTWLGTQVQTLRNYANGVQLFTLANNYSLTEYKPLNLVGFNQSSNTDLTLPEFVFQFLQVQTTSAVLYSTANVERPAQIQNLPNTTTQG